LILFTVKIAPTLQADDCVSPTARCNLDTDQIPSAQKPVVGGVEFAIFGHSLRPVSRIMMRDSPDFCKCSKFSLRMKMRWSEHFLLLFAAAENFPTAAILNQEITQDSVRSFAALCTNWKVAGQSGHQVPNDEGLFCR